MENDFFKKHGNYQDYFISSDFDDVKRLQGLVAVVFEKFFEKHSVNGPVISPEFSLKYKEFPIKTEIPLLTQDPYFVIDKIIPFFKNCVNWGAPGAMFNITPPANILGVAINTLTTLLNPNLAEDRSGGLTAYAEQEVVKCLGSLVKWSREKVTGMSCFGGKATNIYAIRNAIVNSKSILKDKFTITNAFYVSSERGHPCHTEAATLQGISKDNNVVISCDSDGRMNLQNLRYEIEKHISSGQIFLGITLNVGTTMEYIVDDIPAITKMRDEIKVKFNLPYTPLIHADSVLGWTWLFVEKFDDIVLHNKKILPSTIKKVKKMYNLVKDVVLVDSMGIDFHKLGYTAYQSSFFITQSGSKLLVDDLKFGQISTYKTTLELSRGAQGVMGALSSILSFGYEGYINLITNLINSVEIIRMRLESHPMLEVLDKDSLGVCNVVTLTHVKPLVENKLSEEDINIINNMNEEFVKMILQKIENNEVNFYFSFSKSYLAPGSSIRYGGLKMYATSPYLEGEKLEKFINDFIYQVDMFFLHNKNKFKNKNNNQNTNEPYHPIF